MSEGETLTTNSDIVFCNKTRIIYYSHRVFTAQTFDIGTNLKLNLKVNYVGTLEKVCRFGGREGQRGYTQMNEEEELAV